MNTPRETRKKFFTELKSLLEKHDVAMCGCENLEIEVCDPAMWDDEEGAITPNNIQRWLVDGVYGTWPRT